MNTKLTPSIFCLKNGLLSVFVATALIACGSARPPASSDSLLKQANEAINAGAQDRAAELLIQATRQNPTSEVAWIKLAQVQFDRQDYPKAIDAATEALARSPNSAEARSIIFVSSMRLAVTSLSEIRADTPLSDSNKSEAETLVKELRDTLGESILIPGVKAANRPAARSRSRSVTTKAETPTASQPSAPASAPPPVTAKPQTPPNTPSADPFGALR